MGEARIAGHLFPMRIIEDFDSPELALPKAAWVLHDLRGVQTFESTYAARHPCAAYNISLTAIASRTAKVIEELEDLIRRVLAGNSPESLGDDNLLEAMDHLLDALMEHMDVCCKILRCFVAPQDDKKFQKVLTQFRKSIEPYRDHIGTLDNYIKHNQGKLRSVCFTWGTGATLGYFVEGPVSGGALGPVGKIHKDENTAFSFNRDLPFHICNVYAVSSRLAYSLKTINSSLIPMPPSSSVNVRDAAWSKAIKMTAGLPPIFFPDEVHKPIPRVRVSHHKVYIEYPANRPRPVGPLSPSKISILFAGDGVTRSFKMPYFGIKGIEPARRLG